MSFPFVVDDHVLLHRYPDWTTPPKVSTRWQTEIGTAVTGAESRLSLRPGPRSTLDWTIAAKDAEDQRRVLSMIQDAVKSGHACVPFWGRGVRIVSGYDREINTGGVHWNWLEVDDWVLIRDVTATDPMEWDVYTVDGAAPEGLILNTTLMRPIGTSTYIWPLLFGVVEVSSVRHQSNWHSVIGLRLRTLATRPYGSLPPGPDWQLCSIDGADVGDSFECYPIDYGGSLGGGNGWWDPWVIYFIEITVLIEPFNYSVGSTGGWSGGDGLIESWQVYFIEITVTGDDMESYDVDAEPVNGGTGFSAAWVLQDGA